jgi:hypothetical protein
MDEIIKSVLSAPSATLFIISGILFLFIAVVGNISGKIQPDVKGRIASGFLGLSFVFIGLAMQFLQSASKTPGQPTTNQEQIKPNQQPALPTMPTTKATELPNKALPSVTGIEEKEPNDQITDATLIPIGVKIRGSIKRNGDRDFFQFMTSDREPNKTRVILRKLSPGGFTAEISVYDANENTVKYGNANGDDPVSMVFESDPSAKYYLMVKDFFSTAGHGGPFELEIREE